MKTHLVLASGALVLQTALGMNTIILAPDGKPGIAAVKPDIKINGRYFDYTKVDCLAFAECKVSTTCIDFPDHQPSYPKTIIVNSQKYLACCAQDLHLSGSNETAWDCCADGHDLAGPSGQGEYRCCPNNNIYTAGRCVECTGGKKRVGNDCRCPEGMIEGTQGDCQPPQTCPPGQHLEAGRCVCPAGMVKGAKGDCEPPVECPSGVDLGKCYLLSRQNGQYLSLGDTGEYSFALPDGRRLMGRFQVCTDESCSSSSKSVKPDDPIYLRDTFNAGVWLDGSSDGRHISNTTDFQSAGKFSLTKWALGLYCLGGSEKGIGAACSSDTPGITFLPGSPQTCFPVILTEVPCDTKSHYNNLVFCQFKACRTYC